MQLLLIRHAQSANNLLAASDPGNYADRRVSDPGITDLGVQQAAALGAWIGGVSPRPTRLYCSPMKRTIQTATPVADALDLPLEVEDFLYERPGPLDGFGPTQKPARGSSLSDLAAITARAQFPESVTEQGWYSGDVETPQQVAERALDIADWIRRAHSEDDCVAMVIHGAIGALVLFAIICPERLQLMADCPMGSEPWWFSLDNTSTSMISLLPGGGVEVHWINRVDHLVSAGLVTGASAIPTVNALTR